MRDLADRVVVVTGAGSGIGLATARAFAAHGARLHLVDVDADRLEPALAEVKAAGARKVRTHAVDCRETGAVEALASSVVAEDGRVDVLHNNAGVGHAAPVETTALSDWEWVLDLNLWGVIRGIHAFVPTMLEQGEGVIVNTASLAGLLGFPNMAPYCASKFAVVGLSEALDLELRGRGIRVLAVCPGIVRTAIVAEGRVFSQDRDRQRRATDTWHRRGADPERIAAQIVASVRGRRSLLVTPAHAKLLWHVDRRSRRLRRWMVGRVDRRPVDG